MPLLLHFDGVRWRRTAAPAPSGRLSSVSLTSQAAFAVGTTGGEPLILRRLGACWEMTSTSEVPAGTALRTVAAGPRGSARATGSDAARAPVLLHYVRGRWTWAGPPPRAGAGSLEAVAVSDGVVRVVGTRRDGDVIAQPLVLVRCAAVAG